MNIRINISIFILLIPYFTLAKGSDDKPLSRFKWNNISLNLPFSPNWAIEKPRKDPHDPLVFMDPNAAAPRIIANLTETSFDLSSKDLSDFKSKFIKSKSSWVKKINGLITQTPIVAYADKENLFRYEYSFSSPQGSFREFGHFQRCSKKIAFSLRVMIPEEKFKKPTTGVARIINFFRTTSACIH